jgi:endogenous inhibitor of DNA gyrase (YacG/DUF329 family)
MIDLGAWFNEERAIPDRPKSASDQWDEDTAMSSFSPDDSEGHQ